MNKPISKLIFLIAFPLFMTCIISNVQSQTTQQITNGESQRFDANYEQPIIFDGIGHYTSYIDDKVMIYKMDSHEKIYETSFDLCEEGIVDWFINDNDILYVSYEGIIIENINGGVQEKYFYEDLENSHLFTGLTATFYKGLLNFSFFPGTFEFNFDVANRRFLEKIIVNLAFTTEDYFYHSTGFFGDRRFIRFNRTTFESDTLLSNYTPSGLVKSTDKYYVLSEELPLLVVDKNDNIQTYDFEHERISSGIETSTGKLILVELFNEGNIVYQLDIATSNLIRKDTILSEENIEIIDAYQNLIFVEYRTQFTSNFGYFDYQNLEVELFPLNLEFFAQYYSNNTQYLIIKDHNGDDYFRRITLIEKSTLNVESYIFTTQSLWLDDEIEILNTIDGIRFIVSEEAGRSIYKYDTTSNALIFASTIHNKRGLGTTIQKNGNSYLLVDKHNLQSAFEYIHPESKEFLSHEIEGTIYGNVIPYNGKYYYARNKDHQGFDTDYFMDFVMFDPETNNLILLEENYFVPESSGFFGNIVFPQVKFGFVSIYPTPLLFDLRTDEKITPEPEILDLINGIYYETENYFYSTNGGQEDKHFRLDKWDLENQELIYEEDYRTIIAYDDKSFIAVFADEAHFVEEDKVTVIEAPENFNSNFAGTIDSKLLLRGFKDSSTIVVIYDLISGEQYEAEVDGFAADIVGDYIISVTDFFPPYEIISTHVETGSMYSKILEEPYLRIFKTDTSVYVLNKERKAINVFNLKWEALDEFDIDLLDNATLSLISKPNTLPILFKTQIIKSSGINRNELDYDLLSFDPRTNTFESYFDCGSNLRFNKEFEIEAVSTMLLRTEDNGYQIHEVSIPGFEIVSTKELDDKFMEQPSIFPNPTIKYVNINIEYDRAILFNFIGQQLDVFNNEQSINIEEYSSGVYFLRIQLNSEKTYISKIIKH